MKLPISLFLSLCLIFFSISAQAADHKINPGKWEFTHTLTIPGMPGPEVETSVECISPEEAAADPLAEFAEGGCTVLSQKVMADRLDFTLECEQEGLTTTGQGSLKLMGDTTEGRLQVVLPTPGAKMEMVTEWTGRRLGSCE